MIRPAAALLTLALLLPSGGCAGFSEPTPSLLTRIRWIDPIPGPVVRHTVRLDIESRMMSGQFDGVVLARSGPVPVVRTQCFPDVGPKAIDLVARPVRIVGHMGGTNETIDIPIPFEGAPHPVGFMGLTLLEHFAPVTEDRVEGMLEEEHVVWLALRPVVEGSKVYAALDDRNRIVRRRFEWVHGVSWEEEIRPGRSVLRAPGMRMSIEVTATQILDKAADSLFELKK